MKRLLTLALLPVLVVALSQDTVAQDAKKLEATKAALQAFNEFIGTWSGDGKAEKPKSQWAENIEWGWRFKGDDCWLTFKVKDGKFVKSADLKWMPEKQKYQMTVTDAKDEKATYEGEMEKEYLTMERIDPKTKEQQRIVMFNAGDGVFFNYRYHVGPEGRKVLPKVYEVRAKKEGAVFAKGQKGPECVVSGGLGTGTVTYMNKTYYICCSGCRDAFNENPEKYVKAFEAKKK
jgi:hypothetical protein